MITVKTVLKSGGEYKPEHVLRMNSMLDKYVDCPIRLVCYSDINIPGVSVRPLRHDLPGWWSKMEMFRDNDEQSFYIDLDMTINRNITDIVSYKSFFVALRNLNPKIEGIGSAIMGWSGDHTETYKHFIEHKGSIMKAHSKDKVGTPFLGDQGFLWEWYVFCEYYQDIFPNRISKFSLNPNSDILVYFGRNRPWK